MLGRMQPAPRSPKEKIVLNIETAAILAEFAWCSNGKGRVHHHHYTAFE
jgi:hypothetical protein